MIYLNNILKHKKLALLLVFFVYVFFPTNNSSLDAYFYAASIKFNENLFSSHHLLYNVFLWILHKPIQFLNLDILWFSKFVNSVFSTLTLYIFYKILLLLSICKKEAISYLLIAAFSFSFWRYGTENETYIIPIFFSLLGSCMFLIYFNKEKTVSIILCSLFASLACLFHQLHFFWWIGLLIGLLIFKKNLKSVLIYSLIGFIVPTVYILVIKFAFDQELSINNFFQFVFHDFYTGSANSEFTFKNILLTLINCIRVFFQVHVNIFIFLKKNIVFGIPVLVMIYFLCALLQKVINRNLLSRRKKINHPFVFTHSIIFLLHFLFALYAIGNIEFMTMFPFLLLLTAFIKYTPNTKILGLLALTLLIWNFTYAVLPNYKYNYYNDDELLDFIEQNPEKLFIVKNVDLSNKYYYKTGLDSYKNIINWSKIKSKEEIDSILKSQKEIYTDIIDKPTILDRERILSTSSFSLNFDNYKKTRVFTYEGLYGTSTIFKIEQN